MGYTTCRPTLDNEKTLRLDTRQQGQAVQITQVRHIRLSKEDEYMKIRWNFKIKTGKPELNHDLYTTLWTADFLFFSFLFYIVGLQSVAYNGYLFCILALSTENYMKLQI